MLSCLALSVSLALLLTRIACVNVLRGSSPPSTVVIFAVLRFSLFDVEGADAKATERVCIPLTHTHTNCTKLCLYVCTYVCMLVRVRPASWRLTSFGLLILRCFIDKGPQACECVRVCVWVPVTVCVFGRVNSFHLYFALINCDLISNTRSSTAEPRPACRRGVEQLKSKTKATDNATI